MHSLEQQTKFEIMVKKAPQQGQSSTDTKQRGLWRRNKKVGQGGASRNDACGTDAAVAELSRSSRSVPSSQSGRHGAGAHAHGGSMAPRATHRHVGVAAVSPYMNVQPRAELVEHGSGSCCAGPQSLLRAAFRGSREQHAVGKTSRRAIKPAQIEEQAAMMGRQATIHDQVRVTVVVRLHASASLEEEIHGKHVVLLRDTNVMAWLGTRLTQCDRELAAVPCERVLSSVLTGALGPRHLTPWSTVTHWTRKISGTRLWASGACRISSANPRTRLPQQI